MKARWKRAFGGAVVLGAVLAAGAGALVRADPPPGHFTVNGDDTVTDNHTGLVWQRTIPASSYARASAGVYCDELVHAGSSAWRLPTLFELISIVDETRVSPAIDSSAFPSTPSSWFWSTSLSGSEGSLVNFNSGDVGYVVVTAAHRARCVR